MFQRLCMSILFGLTLSPLASADDSNTAPTHYPSKWYDVGEWFGDNDYIKSDEAVERVKPDAKKTHTPNQYIDRDHDGVYEVMRKFFDANADGVNDTVATYTDTDEDGTYDTVSYRSTIAKEVLGNNNQIFVAEDLGKYSGRRERVHGKVLETKPETNNSSITEWIIKLQSDDGKSSIVNLGNDGDFQIFKGDTLTAWGPVVRDGDQTILVATEIETAGKNRVIIHHGHSYSGVIQSTSEATVDGETQLIVKVKTDTGKMFTVDFPSDQDTSKIKKDQRVTVNGVPIAVDDHIILLAMDVQFPTKK